ncbi:MAG: hypothetical protein IJ198_01585 [Lachnospiraceae bacterium]|nr:hypothetical protein [Lachnospiraceae bacterium]
MKELICTFYRPEKVNINEFCGIITKLEDDLDTLCNENIDASDICEYVYRLAGYARPLKRDPKMYFLGLDEPENMPGDARVDFFYRPTYLGAAIMIRSVMLHPELLNAADRYGAAVKITLPGILLGCTGREFSGHGYDWLKGLIETLTIFTKAGTAQFVEKYPYICNEFSDLYISSMNMIEKRVCADTVKNQWGEDYTKEAQLLLKDYHGEASASSESSSQEEKPSCVWYASYGSNINSTRFQEYLDSCGGDVSTTESKPFLTHGTLYFAASSERWGIGMGVAFFDEESEGTVLTRIYKVSHEQILSIQSQEGSKYCRSLMLGIVDGLPVYTFTSPEKRDDLNAPSADYVRTILTGLKEAYPGVSETVLLSYLIKHGALNDNARKVLTYIRRAPHAVKLGKIAEQEDCPDIDEATAAIQFLLGIGLIKQDSRSIRAGHSKEDLDALFYTVQEKRDMIDQVVFNVI